MRYESIKTGLLTFLIILSGLLTWNIWTYQPNYESTGNEKTVNEVALGTKKEVKKIVKPDQIVFHIDGNPYGTSDNSVIDPIIAMIGKWKYYDVRKFSDSSSELNKILSKGQFTEIIFPDEVPVDLYKRVLSFEDENLPKFEFDRIIIDTLADQRQEGYIYFYSSKSQEAYLSNVSLAGINEFFHDFQQKGDQHSSVFAYTLANDMNVYLPVQETKMKKYTYYRNPIEPEQLKVALFRDPSFVQRSIVSDGEEYTDEASKMTVDNNTNMIYYVNPFRENEAVIGTESLIQKSIEFVNGHSGWTDNYRYAYKDDFNQRVVFRMYSDEGYPIYNLVGMSEILQVWGQTEINRYIRPSFYLDLPLNSEMKSVSLPSGQEVVDSLVQKKDWNPELLDDIMLGYYMVKDPVDSSIIFLEPGWFYQYDGVWLELELDGEVIGSGLEPN